MRKRLALVAVVLTTAVLSLSSSRADDLAGLPRIASREALPAAMTPGWTLTREPWSNAKDYGMVLASAPLPVRSGDASVRIELRRGDCGKLEIADRWDDCLHGNERVELVANQGSWNRRNTRAAYRWSFYLPPDWNPEDLSQVVMGQFHQADSHPAFWVFYQSQGGGLQVKRRVGETRNSYGTHIRTIIPEKELRGRWHDIRVEARWRRDEKGYFRVFVNGAEAYNFEGSTMDAQEVFFKLGIYRISPPLKAPTLIVYYDDIAKE